MTTSNQVSAARAHNLNKKAKEVFLVPVARGKKRFHNEMKPRKAQQAKTRGKVIGPTDRRKAEAAIRQ